jgi:hypothetical protein
LALKASRTRSGATRPRCAPTSTSAQDIPNRVDRYAPKSASDIAVNIAVMKWMQRWPFRPIAAKIWFTAADSIDLPHYPMVGAT